MFTASSVRVALPLLPNMHRRGLFILGMHRSGTSLLAALLRMGGVELGSDVMTGPAEDNPRGYWESREVVRIDDEVLARLGLSWCVPGPLPADYEHLPRVATLVDRAAGFLRDEFAGSPLWGIKDPRLCRLQGFWERACGDWIDELHAVHVFRHPLEVADSLMARNHMPAEQAMLLWLFHNLEAVLHARPRPLLMLPMQRLLEDPVGSVAYIRVGVGETAPLTDEATIAIRRFVEPSLRHHHLAPDDRRLKTRVGRLAARCHECLERSAAGADVRDELGGLHDRLLAVVDQKHRRLAPRIGKPVDVIVKGSGTGDNLRRCIDAVQDGGGRFSVVTILPAGHRQATSGGRRGRAAREACPVIVTAKHADVTESISRGLALHPNRDVVVLHETSIVPRGWLDRLQNIAYSSPSIGTVSTFSNHPSPCSYPVPDASNPLPPGLDAATLDAMFSEANGGLCLDVPAAADGCTYIRRDCLDDVGFLEEGRAAQGLGAEAAFSIRAAGRGWRNVLATDVFVCREDPTAHGASAAGWPAPNDLPHAQRAAVERFVAEDLPAFARHAVDEVRLARRGSTELGALLEERARVHAMQRRTLDKERVELLREVARRDEALGHAQRMVCERDVQIRQLTSALAEAERLATERLQELADGDRQLHDTCAALAAAEKLAGERLAQVRQLADAKAAAERIAAERLRELADRDRQLHDTYAVLTTAEKLAGERLAQVRQLADAKAAAERIATERTRSAAALDGQLGELSAVKAVAERLAAERLQELASRDRQLQDTAAALAVAERLAVERLAQVQQLAEAKAAAERIAMERTRSVAALNGQLGELSAAKAVAERLAAERLRELADRDQQLRDTAAALAVATHLALERLATLEALDRRLGDSAAALRAAEDIARERLTQIEDLTRRIADYSAAAGATAGERSA